jgi:predicted deacylase
MRVETIGDGTPEIAIVGGIHGDEPCGVRAVERLVADPPDVDCGVKLIVANEEAVARETRYVETDLNRSFPGDPDGETHEERLAARLTEEIGDCKTLALHSTQSTADAFALVDSVGDLERGICRHLSVRAVVETGHMADGRVFASCPSTVEVECGLQGSEAAAENAYTLCREFLVATGALAAPPDHETRTSLPVFRLSHPVPKDPADEYEVLAANFEEVAVNEVFARADTRELRADRGFYPVLMSPYGYEDVFGYMAEQVGVID